MVCKTTVFIEPEPYRPATELPFYNIKRGRDACESTPWQPREEPTLEFDTRTCLELLEFYTLAFSRRGGSPLKARRRDAPRA